MLPSLPVDILQNIVVAAESSQPLGPCASYTALKNTCRTLRRALYTDAVHAALCRLKFDTSAIERRTFRLTTNDLADQFLLNMRLMQAISHAVAIPDRTYLEIMEDGVDDTEDMLRAAWMLLLENDGKNYAQLNHVGFYTFIDRFVRRRLWEGRDANAGWPRDTPLNALALTCMWMMSTQERLDDESEADKAELKTLIVPFVLCTPRYASSEAPPNHFDLPLVPTDRPQQEPITLATADSPVAPKYPHYLPNHANRVVSMPLWGAYLTVASPLCTTAARLLWIARQPPMGIPPHLPLVPGPNVVGMTQQHYRTFNDSPAARLIAGPSWDWNSDAPVPLQSTTQTFGREDSRRWDTEFWRKVLCTDHTAPKPRFSPGEVYRKGSLRGTWRGRCYMPFGQHFTAMIANPLYPGVPDPMDPERFTDFSLAPVPIPLCFEVEEHHRICGCPSLPSVEDESGAFHPDGQGCGIIPIPPVVQHDTIRVLTRFANEELHGANPTTITLPQHEHMEYGMTNSWFPGRLGHVNFVKRPQSIPARPGYPIRDEAVFGFDLSNPPSRDANASCRNLQDPDSPTAPGSFRPDQDPIAVFPVPPPAGSGPFVYETFDPAKASIHDVMPGRRARNQPECQGCLQLETQRREERERMAFEAKAALDQMIREYVPPSSMPRDGVPSSSAPSNPEEVEIQDLYLGSGDGLSMLVDVLQKQFSQSSAVAGGQRQSSSGSCSPSKGKGKRAFDEMELDQTRTHSDPSPSTSSSDSPSPFKQARSSSASSPTPVPSSAGPSTSSTLFLDPKSPNPPDIAVGIKMPVVDPMPLGSERLDYTPAPAEAARIARLLLQQAMEAEVTEGDDVSTQTPSSPAHTFDTDRTPSPIFAPTPTISPWFSRSGTDPGAFSFKSFYDRPVPRQPKVFGDDVPNATDNIYVCVRPDHQSPSPSPTPSEMENMDVDSDSEMGSPLSRIIKATGWRECEGGCQFVLRDPERPVFDRHRVGLDCTGVKDIVFTGQTESDFAVADWKSTLYGRIRPWDGLVGMLRTAVTMNGQPQFFFVFGYITGEETFVGEWRFAATQPWRPTWSGPFVMSKVSNQVLPSARFQGIPPEGLASVN